MDLFYWVLVALEITIGALVIYEINSPKSTYRVWRAKKGRD